MVVAGGYAGGCIAANALAAGGAHASAAPRVVDSVPQLRDVARDLGIWGIASNLPSVVAPVAGGWLLAQFAQPLTAYRALFIAAGLSFALASAIILMVGERRRF